MSKPKAQVLSSHNPACCESGAYLVSSANVEQIIHGTMVDALHLAAELAYLETDWPKKLGEYGAVTIRTENEVVFRLNVSTPRRRPRKDK